MKDELTKAIELEIALKTIEALPKEQKDRLLADAILRKLETMNIAYEAGRILESYTIKYVHEFVKQKDVQEKLRQKAHDAVDKVIDGITKKMGEVLEDFIKCKYERLLSEPKLTDKN